ncbi:hypothetical protein ABZT34_32155 [Streptomyces sp. NPDC005329]|uniref:hypothetical protein n=1 Tax=Streptomyces sp. NPDC005329 TaxID=3157034 RepID=UPI0033A56699
MDQTIAHGLALNDRSGLQTAAVSRQLMPLGESPDCPTTRRLAVDHLRPLTARRCL